MPLDCRKCHSARLALFAVAFSTLPSSPASANYVIHDLHSITGGDVSSTFKNALSAVGGKVIGTDNSSLHALLWEGAGSPTPLVAHICDSREVCGCYLSRGAALAAANELRAVGNDRGLGRTRLAVRRGGS